MPRASWVGPGPCRVEVVASLALVAYTLAFAPQRLMVTFSRKHSAQMLEEESAKAEFNPQSRQSSQHWRMNPHSWSLEMLLRRLRAIETKKDDKFARVLDAVGEFGTFQRRLVALTFIPNILSSFFMFADHFVFAEQTPYCNTSWILAVGPNLTEAEQLNLTLPRAPNGSFLTCLMYLPVPWDLESIIQYGLNHTDTCQNGWIYPHSKKRSLVNEFDLVCDKQMSKETVQTMFMAGLLIGSLIFGFISDKLGRYPCVLLSLLGLVIFGFGTAFVNSFHQYLFFRFGVSQAVMGYSISSVALATEWLVGEHRTHGIILEHCFFSMGLIFLIGFSYSIPHWRLLFLVGGVPMFPLISYIWILPESPRWLMMKGKVKEAKKVLCYAAGVNKKTIPLDLLNELQLPGKKVNEASILDLYSNKYLCKMTLVVGCVWLTVSYTYFTLSFKMKDYGVSTQFSQVVPSIMEVPSRLCCIFLLQQLGRKWTLAVTLIQATIMCLLILIIPQELTSTIILLLIFGEFSLAATVTVSFVYTAELFPTVLRGTGLGLVSLASAAGAISSLTIISQAKTLLPIFLCCLSSIVALCFSSMLPETQDQPLSDSLEHLEKSSIQKDSSPYSNHYVRRSKDTTTAEVAESSSDDITEEVVKNTIFNTHGLKMDPSPPSSPASEQLPDEEVPSPAP